MTIHYISFYGRGDYITEARSYALDKLNNFIQLNKITHHELLSLTEEDIPAKYDEEPCVVYLHLYYIWTD